MYSIGFSNIDPDSIQALKPVILHEKHDLRTKILAVVEEDDYAEKFNPRHFRFMAVVSGSALAGLCGLIAKFSTLSWTANLSVMVVASVTMVYLTLNGSYDRPSNKEDVYDPFVWARASDRLFAGCRDTYDALVAKLAAFNTGLKARQIEDASYRRACAEKDPGLYEDDVRKWHAHHASMVSEVKAMEMHLAERVEVLLRPKRLATIEQVLGVLESKTCAHPTLDLASYASTAAVRQQTEDDRNRLGLPPEIKTLKTAG